MNGIFNNRRIELLNGKHIQLRSGKMSNGSYDTKKELLTYKVYYPLEGHLKVLRESEIDKIKVHWSSGFEEYQVFQMDFFMHQIKCLHN